MQEYSFKRINGDVLNFFYTDERDFLYSFFDKKNIFEFCLLEEYLFVLQFVIMDKINELNMQDRSVLEKEIGPYAALLVDAQKIKRENKENIKQYVLMDKNNFSFISLAGKNFAEIVEELMSNKQFLQKSGFESFSYLKNQQQYFDMKL